MTQSQIAARRGMSQAAVSQILQTPVVEIKPEFSGGTVAEIIKRYVSEEISADRLVDELSRWEYEPVSESKDPWLWEPDSREGTWNEVVSAVLDGDIEAEVYEAIRLARKRKQG